MIKRKNFIAIFIAATLLGMTYLNVLHSELVFSQNLPVQRDRIITLENFSANRARLLILLILTSTVGLLGWYLAGQGRTSKGSGDLIKTSGRKTLLDQVSPRLRRQLLRLVSDPKTVNRLLLGIQRQHRDRSPNWIAEKVIYDLKRGR